MTYQLVYSSLTPSTRCPTGTVLVLLTPVEARPQYRYCEDLTLQNRPCVSSHFSSSGTRVSSDAGTFGTLGWIWTSDFWDLQSHALDRSATSALFLFSCIIHNLALCVKWWRARDSNPVYRKVEDLQSPEVTNASRSPYMVDRPGFEPGTEACKATVFPTIPTAQIFWRLVMESNHR